MGLNCPLWLLPALSAIRSCYSIEGDGQEVQYTIDLKLVFSADAMGDHELCVQASLSLRPGKRADPRFQHCC